MTDLPPGAGPVDRLRPGTLLREWRIGRFVARGSFGQVFEAHRASWMAGEPPRALKVFDPITSSAARAALVGEFDMLRSTWHPNLLRGEDAFDVEDGPFAGCVVFVLELADTDLASELGRRGRLPPAEVAAIGAQAARGLAALHAGGHLHGDVKPANLLRVGPDWKLGDFGVSSAVQGSYAVAPGATLDYTPPELSTESDGFRVHRSADVWALGVTLWVAATGRHPFAGATPYTRLGAALRGDRAPATIDRDLGELIDDCCLVTDPRSRTPAADLAERMAALFAQPTGQSAQGAAPTVHGPPPEPESDAVPGRTWQLTRRTAPSAPPPEPPVQRAAAQSSPPPSAELSRAELWRRIRLGICAGLAATLTAGIVHVSSLAAAALPFDLIVRRTVYLVLAVSALVAVGWMLRPLGSSTTRWSAVAGAVTTLLVATGWLFWGG